MSGVRIACVTGEIVTGTSAKTLLKIDAAANHRVLINEFSISFIGTSNTAQPIKVDILTVSDDGTFTGLTPAKVISTDDETLEVTAWHTATAEPTYGTVLFTEEVHPQTGYTWQSPFGREFHIPGGTCLALRVTAAASTSAVARAFGEE